MIYRDEEYAAQERIKQLEEALAVVESRLAATPRPPRIVWQRWRWILVFLVAASMSSCTTAILANGSIEEECLDR